MNTAFLLMAQYEGRAIIPVDVVSKDYFNLTTAKFLAKTTSGEIELAVVRMEAASQKAAKGVHLLDLAIYIDQRRAAARKEMQALCG